MILMVNQILSACVIESLLIHLVSFVLALWIKENQTNISLGTKHSKANQSCVQKLLHIFTWILFYGRVIISSVSSTNSSSNIRNMCAFVYASQCIWVLVYLQKQHTWMNWSISECVCVYLLPVCNWCTVGQIPLFWPKVRVWTLINWIYIRLSDSLEFLSNQMPTVKVEN